VLFPSKLEGMGFPPVEAMRHGKPVFASTYSSIPEISEDKAYYWEHFEPGYMASVFHQKMAEFAANPTLGAMLHQHSLKFSWQTNVSAYLNLFKNILK
jgi:glycosyltransferase involved in cell wall biosynthesis